MRVWILVLAAACGTKDGDEDGVPSTVDCDDDNALIGEAVSVWVDGDGDDFGDAADGEACAPADGQALVGGDCDDADPAVNPDAYEICNFVDDDCNGAVDEGAGTSLWLLDADGDAYGDPDTLDEHCGGEGYVQQSGDCEDADPDVHPGAPELCDGRDQDCDGFVDEDASDAQTWYYDLDGDGFGDEAGATVGCDAPPGTVDVSGDCDDGDPNVYPDAPEVCDDVDNDCDFGVDEDLLEPWWEDDDGDGHGDPDGDRTTTCEGLAPEGYAPIDDDCDDGDPTVYPDAPELCDGVDNDCDGFADDDVIYVDYLPDADGDGFGAAGPVVTSCDGTPVGTTEDGGDCDDGHSSVYPGAKEACDGLDTDCDGVIPADETTDLDADGFVACRDPDDTDPLLPDAPTWMVEVNNTVGSSYSYMEIVHTTDDDSVAVGSGGGGAGWIVRFEREGAVAFQKTYPIYSAAALEATSDGGFLLAGERASYDDPSLVKTDADGNVSWTYAYDVGYAEQGFYAVREVAGGYRVSGIYDSFIDSSGSLDWMKVVIGGGGNCNGVDVTLDGGTVSTGEGSYGTPASDYNSVLTKMDLAGTVAWSRAYGASAYDWASDVSARTDGTYAITGWTTSTGTTACWMGHVDSGGTLLWSRTYTLGGSSSTCEEVLETPSGGFLLAGTWNNQIGLLELDPSGLVIQGATYAAGTAYGAVRVDTGWAVVGRSSASRTFVARTDDLLSAGCEAPLSPVVTDFAMSQTNNSTGGFSASTPFSVAGAATAAPWVRTDLCP